MSPCAQVPRASARAALAPATRRAARAGSWRALVVWLTAGLVSGLTAGPGLAQPAQPAPTQGAPATTQPCTNIADADCDVFARLGDSAFALPPDVARVMNERFVAARPLLELPFEWGAATRVQSWSLSPSGDRPLAIGVVTAKASEFPAHYVLRPRRCAATAIAPGVLITAAHCIDTTRRYAVQVAGKAHGLACTRHPDYAGLDACKLATARAAATVETAARCSDVARCVVTTGAKLPNPVALAAAFAVAGPTEPLHGVMTLGGCTDAWSPAFVTLLHFDGAVLPSPAPPVFRTAPAKRERACPGDSGSGLHRPNGAGLVGVVSQVGQDPAPNPSWIDFVWLGAPRVRAFVEGKPLPP